MSLNVMLSSAELAAVNQEVNAFNKALSAGKTVTAGGDMGKDEFLKILITQLSHQDPTQPMQDKEFIAQMAQFSSLEQMTNVVSEITKVAALLAKGQAVSLLGKTVEIAAGSQIVEGMVDEVSGGDFPQILVNGLFYDVSQVQTVRRAETEE
ncbi:MAG: flagellar hook assembly protein FlgD [Spirochaetes bacterium RBG_13_68_11]|nr:MAG: flagellar hook assembly protein FlgD [Spirochaetes bacterium RBG_13_68_11]